MVRGIGALIGLFFAVMALWAFGTGLGAVASQGYLKETTVEGVFHREPKHLALQSDGPFGTFNMQQVQRGYQVYKEVCKACHSLNHVAFRDLAELGYDPAEVKAEAASWTVPGIDPNTGETTTRPGTPTDYFPKPFANDIAARAANAGAIPPDLSLMAKAREGGAPYIYSILTGFQPVPADLKKKFPDFQAPTGTYFNPYFANLNIKMPPPLTSDGQVTFKDGTPSTVDEMAKDVAAFLVWTAEPTQDKRRQTGWPVLGFLIFASVLAFLAKKQVWATAKARRED